MVGKKLKELAALTTPDGRIDQGKLITELDARLAPESSFEDFVLGMTYLGGFE